MPFKRSGPFILGRHATRQQPRPKDQRPKIKDPKIKDPKIKDQCHGTMDTKMPFNRNGPFLLGRHSMLSFTKCNGLQIKEGQGTWGTTNAFLRSPFPDSTAIRQQPSSKDPNIKDPFGPLRHSSTTQIQRSKRNKHQKNKDQMNKDPNKAETYLLMTSILLSWFVGQDVLDKIRQMKPVSLRDIV